ncbi:hypothetical protein L227DRAFT_653372 [Lentinus tigrinus ALCF2SS1-6]|uniref:Transcription activator of gluconeogenesis ERT1 n=1 Tax=Lentinus tigrinus ALCF2SS1-6 TaxID=1328759 RepID=A0A5C2S8V8_9APHY|nr:hypothetical protein L227DRAFT_653372 [Lentinus tigrinus ALCF2SS1-6]
MSMSTADVWERSSSAAGVNGDLLETKTIITPVMPLPGRKLLVITTTHRTSIVDGCCVLPPNSGVPSLPDISANTNGQQPVKDSEETRSPAATNLTHGDEVRNAENRKSVRNACISCHEKHKTCDIVRPCMRCLKAGIDCKDRVRKPIVAKKHTRKPGVSHRGRQSIAKQPESATASTSAVTLDATEPSMHAAVRGSIDAGNDWPIGVLSSWNDAGLDSLLAELHRPPEGYMAPSLADAMFPDPLLNGVN